MAINEWKLWKKAGLVKEDLQEVNIKDDLNAIISSLRDLNLQKLTIKIEKMREMVREEDILSEELKKANLKKQLELITEILKDQEFLENDVDINGLRLKKINQELLRKASDLSLAEKP